jgi:hypothetical protein
MQTQLFESEGRLGDASSNSGSAFDMGKQNKND